MLLLGLDLETDGVDVENCKVIEIGAVLFDTELGQPVKIFSELIREEGVNVTEEIKSITGISDEMLSKYGLGYGLFQVKEAISFKQMFLRANYIVAHNGNNFDKPVLENLCKRMKIKLPEKHWIDTMNDIPYPAKIETRKLEFLTGLHGFLNPFPHRAFADVLSMLKILMQYDLDQVIEISRSPVVKFVAQVPFAKKDLAKNAGFKWSSDLRSWIIEVKECLLDQEKYENDTLWDFKYKEV